MRLDRQVVVATLALAGLLLACRATGDRELRLTLELKCPTPERCTSTLTNRGSTLVFLDKQLRTAGPELADLMTMQITVRDAEGRERPMTGHIAAAPAVPMNFKELMPQESIAGSQDIAGMYSLTTGRYTVRTRYHARWIPDELKGRDIWQGPLDSNEVVLDVP